LNHLKSITERRTPGRAVPVCPVRREHWWRELLAAPHRGRCWCASASCAPAGRSAGAIDAPRPLLGDHL